ncbi:Oidioi.mRNA.OKI2018_I69.XSR.g13300.t1.cds [Oikopleura dioica]|uniref:Oidioi.mRNA.OKI2018_I69.XSR.g13300.t1.cds n=1 Tax=Oikopleura dioica TaxID=34765 RepID=A0ABN7S6H3_OIKDI|nr:Oidioi.mRNA.OKI2018_I69.XSR.g13300.t1.cds [Oikopleura dioica]
MIEGGFDRSEIPRKRARGGDKKHEILRSLFFLLIGTFWAFQRREKCEAKTEGCANFEPVFLALEKRPAARHFELSCSGEICCSQAEVDQLVAEISEVIFDKFEQQRLSIQNAVQGLKLSIKSLLLQFDADMDKFFATAYEQLFFQNRVIFESFQADLKTVFDSSKSPNPKLPFRRLFARIRLEYREFLDFPAQNCRFQNSSKSEINKKREKAFSPFLNPSSSSSKPPALFCGSSKNCSDFGKFGRKGNPSICRVSRAKTPLSDLHDGRESR